MNVIDAIVCPKQKLVKIVSGKSCKRPNVIKIYRFNQDIPLIKEIRTVTKYDYSAWCISERDYEEQEIVSFYDPKIVEEIKQKALNHYQNTYQNNS